MRGPRNLLLAMFASLGLGSPLIAQSSPSRPSLPENADVPFRNQVDAAVDRAIAWIKGQQQPDGGFGDIKLWDWKFRAGPTALALFTLLTAGVNKHDPRIERGFRYLADHPASFTYEAGLVLLALDQKGAPLYERFDLERMNAEARAAYKFPRELTQPERWEMTRCVSFLSRNRNGGLWGYEEYPGNWDISNSHLALLGLKAAVRSGVAVPPEVWLEAHDAILDAQMRTGPAVNLPVIDRLSLSSAPTFSSLVARARGWGYRASERAPSAVTGSRTAIGIASLILSREEMLGPGAKRVPRSRLRGGEHREAVRDGLAWLNANFAADRNPQSKEFFTYYLYALERVGTLTESRFIGKHDWYREGAEQLVKSQQPDGSWWATEWSGSFPSTCFGLLFLRRSTYPPTRTRS